MIICSTCDLETLHPKLGCLRCGDYSPECDGSCYVDKNNEVQLSTNKKDGDTMFFFYDDFGFVTLVHFDTGQIFYTEEPIEHAAILFEGLLHSQVKLHKG